MLISILVNLIANAFGLIAAAAILDDMSLNASGFFIAVVVFTVIEVVIQPLIIQMSMRNARALAGSSALIASLVALVITAWVSDGLQISGAVTWVLATVIVWAAALLAAFILPAVVFKRWLSNQPAR
jgi:uncharacterized membrane protein YvlD (DUF360 family)